MYYAIRHNCPRCKAENIVAIDIHPGPPSANDAYEYSCVCGRENRLQGSPFHHISELPSNAIMARNVTSPITKVHFQRNPTGGWVIASEEGPDDGISISDEDKKELETLS